MGLRETTFAAILVDAGLDTSTTMLPVPTFESIVVAGLGDLATQMYRRLGGIMSLPRIAPREWDVVAGGVAWELDEEQHFNRYRLITLRSGIYRRLKSFDRTSYRRYCVAHEHRCLRKAGRQGYWTNKSTVAEFGPGGEPGVFSGGGSPRWKQRAYYDFVKDLSPLLLNLRMVRVSVWDAIAGESRTASVGWVLDQVGQGRRGAERWKDVLAQLCISRVEAARQTKAAGVVNEPRSR